MKLFFSISRIVLFLSFAIFKLNVSYGQLPVTVDQLSDQQLIQYLNQAQLSGLSDSALEVMARQKGIPEDQIAKLKIRIASLPKSTLSGNNTNYNQTNNATTERLPVIIKKPSEKSLRSKIFGAELFENENLTFDPNLKIATPRNYVLGEGDQIHIDIFGYSETSYSLKISPDGSINIPNSGPVRVAGLTIEDADKKITSLLIKSYPQIATGKTFVQVTLGQIRSIKVTIIGEISKPGTYTISSLATIANALYASGGPGPNGSFRSIDLVRNGKILTSFDLYDFLLKGDLSKNLLLQDDDIINVLPYNTRVELQGAIKRQAIFEVKENETLSDVINRFAGGLADEAYKDNLKVIRIGTKEKEIINIPFATIPSFSMRSGDVYVVDSIVNRFTNRVQVKGAVYHPGDYSVSSYPTLKALLDKAVLKENAYLKRAVIRRLQEDFTPLMINFNATDIISGKSDIELQREDSVMIFSVFDVQEKYTVQINGEVNKPGTYNFSDSLRLQDLILMAGGFKEGASGKKIEIARRIKDSVNEEENDNYAIVKVIELDRHLEETNETSKFLLSPFDIVSVRKSPSYKEQETVTLEGQVLYPGNYTIKQEQEKLSDLIKRSGGLKTEAYPEGAVLLRKSPGSTETENRLRDINRIKLLSTSDSTNSLNKDSLLNNAVLNTESVGIRLEEAIKNPGSMYDIYVQAGDIISVPKKLQTVTTWGAVYLPKQVVYSEGKSFWSCINESGGFSPQAYRTRSFVIYANGEIARTHHFLFFRRYPKVAPGAEVYVPLKKAKRTSSLAEISGIAAILSAIATTFWILKNL